MVNNPAHNYFDALSNGYNVGRRGYFVMPDGQEVEAEILELARHPVSIRIIGQPGRILMSCSTFNQRWRDK